MAPRIFFSYFSMALYHKWDVKNDFAYVLQFFSLISDILGGVYYVYSLIFFNNSSIITITSIKLILQLIITFLIYWFVVYY